MKKYIRLLAIIWLISTHLAFSQKTGINQPNPTQALDVKGKVKIDSAAYIKGNVGIGTENPQAVLDVQSTTTGALAMPRMTTAQRNAIVNPQTGMMIYNTETNCIDVCRTNGRWHNTCAMSGEAAIEQGAIQNTIAVQPIPTKRYGGVAFSINGKGYVGTGYGNNYMKDFWEYNPATNSWTQKADFGGVARTGAVGFAINGKGYIGTGGNPSGLKDFWEYDPATNSWTQKANFGGTERRNAVGFCIGDKGYIGTGRRSPSLTIYQDFWEYNPTTNTWTQKADVGSLTRHSAAGFSLNGKGYIGTGINSVSLKDFWEYDPTTNSWTQKADVGLDVRNYATGFSTGNSGYIALGDPIAERGKELYRYNPITDSWKKIDIQLFSTERSQATAFVISDSAYIGTGVSSSPKGDFVKYYESAVVVKPSPIIGATEFPNNTGTSGQVLVTNGTGTASWQNLAQQWADSANNIYRPSGNVGIGTATPNAKLEVKKGFFHTYPNIGTNNGTLMLASEGIDGNSTAITFGGNSGGSPASGAQAGIYVESSSAYGTKMYFGTTNNFATGSQARMIIDHAGNVGIGTITPSEKLEVTGKIKATHLQVTSGATLGNVLTADATGNATWQVLPTFTETDPKIGSITQNFLSKWNGTALVTSSVFDSGTNIGIGETAPNSKLEIKKGLTHSFPTVGQTYSTLTLSPEGGNNNSTGISFRANEGGALAAGAQAGIYVQSSSAYGTKMYFGTTNSFATGSQTRMMIDHIGNVGIGTTTPTQKLQVGTNGDGSVAIANAWNVFSDRRFKRNIQTLENPWQRLLQVRGVRYNWIASGKKDIGFIAQELEAVYPELVSTGTDDYKSVDYARMSAILLEAIKDLKMKIEKLESKNIDTETRLKKLEVLVNQYVGIKVSQ